MSVLHVEEDRLRDVPDHVTLALLVGGEDEDVEEDGVEEQDQEEQEDEEAVEAGALAELEGLEKHRYPLVS